jgi:uncharacterized protein
LNQLQKRKIFNDPIYGFVSIPSPVIYDLIEHPWFQRLRRIKQLGLTPFVYPGALHTRFHHAIGAMHLMGEAIESLRYKGVKITEEEATAVTIAILLHDIGHGPFSHSLEHSIVHGINHEYLSGLFMDRLNKEFNGELDMAICIFRNEYKKKFLHKLVSSQVDVDRLDYLKRDSFFTGVSEGIINSDRIITMLTVANGDLAVESKGIYSIEKFIIARRLMYWQVYLHKTVIAAENLLINILRRAKELALAGEELFCTPSFGYFLYKKIGKKDFERDPKVLDKFALLDDYDIFTSVKVWCDHSDKVLSTLCKGMVNRQLYRIELENKPFEQEKIDEIRRITKKKMKLKDDELDYFVFTNSIRNSAYDPGSEKINIYYKEGKLVDIAEAADQLNISVLSKPVEKYFLCYPKDCVN